MGDGGFTKEQLAIAKQLQAGYCSSGTFKASSSSNSTGPRQQVGRQSAPPVRMPPSGTQTRSQTGSMLRSSNGLVRPLPSGAHPAPASRNAPGPTFSPNIIQPTSVQKSKSVKSVPQSAPKPTQSPSAPATGAQKAPMQPAPKPASQPAPQPVVKPAAALPSSQPTATPAHRPPPLNRDLLSMEPLPIISTPTMVATPVSQDTEMANSGFGIAPAQAPVPVQAPVQASAQAPEERKAAPVAPSGPNVPATDLVLNAPAAVREAIKINQSGKPILWNYMTEAPSVRELSKAEKEGMGALPPPGPEDRLPWVRAWHPSDQPLRPGPNGEIIDEDTMPTKPVIGLMGSRHA